MPRRLMVLPSLACPASCVYCFGPNTGGPQMRRETLEAVVRWQDALGNGDGLDITFHGGEPLVPGAGWYRLALPLLRDRLAPREVRFGLQSNLWLLTDELCELFFEFGVSIGTSLDGPEEINDAQRGAGYFRRTLAGIERARAHCLDVGAICTFTAQSAPHADEIFDFFLAEGLNFSVHAALPSLRHPEVDGWSLAPEAHGELLVRLLERYLAHADKVRIGTLDAMSRSFSAGRGGICTFGDCLGEYLAVDPQGFIYPCQRFAGMPGFLLGNVHECPSLQALAEARAWRLFAERQARIEEKCGDCPHLDYCRGGCPYNAIAHGGEGFDAALRDPHCPAYRRAFDAIAERALQEVFSDENLAAVVEQGPGKHGLMRRGRLLQIMRDGPHPQKVARRAREVVAAVSLAVSASPEEALGRLDRAGIVTRPDAALASLGELRRRLDTQSERALLNAYLHVTYACNLRCSHCYARSEPGKSQSMPVEDLARLVREMAQAGFRKAVVTGGEPLAHPQRERLLDELAALRLEVKPLEIVLRTNLTRRLTPALVRQLISSTDHVIVSVDGDEAAHDARRGTGSYARTVANLRSLASLASESAATSGVPPAQVSIAAALDAPQMDGAEAEAVRALAEELGLPVRFKPLLPLGRAEGQGLAPELYSSLDDEAEALACGAHIAATCGLGMNLYVGPNGESFPCYALVSTHHELGNALTNGLAAVLKGNDAYRKVTVDTNERCRACAFRYLCGGLCRAWSAPGDFPNVAPASCSALHRRARDRLLGALATLNVPPERWLAASLPLPGTPPNRE
jgi:uncharacterized protein